MILGTKTFAELLVIDVFVMSSFFTKTMVPSWDVSVAILDPDSSSPVDEVDLSSCVAVSPPLRKFLSVSI